MAILSSMINAASCYDEVDELEMGEGETIDLMWRN